MRQMIATIRTTHPATTIAAITPPERPLFDELVEDTAEVVKEDVTIVLVRKLT